MTITTNHSASSYGQPVILADKDKIMTTTETIRSAAQDLYHDWIILDALKRDKNPDLGMYMDVINKIREVEAYYSDEQIEQGDLLCDIW